MLLKRGSRGASVKQLQQKLKELGYYKDRIDGDFGPKTYRAVRIYQRENNISVDGIVGKNTWKILTGEKKKVVSNKIFNPVFKSLSGELLEYHREFNGSIQWKLTKEGVMVPGDKIERSRGEPLTVKRVWNDFGEFIEKWSKHYKVPSELILSTICTESRGKSAALRKEPGYKSDSSTPHRISPGLMQTLISTARSILGDDSIDREWLFDSNNSIKAGTAYIASQARKTDLDPPKVACAYNSGGIYYQKSQGNRWKMRQYPIGTSHHADRFIMWFNDFRYLINIGEVKISTGFF